MVFDIVLILVLCVSVFIGGKKGFLRVASRLISLIMSGICTSICVERLEEWLSGTSLYQEQYAKLTMAINSATDPKETLLMASLAEEAEKMAETVAQNILSALLSGVCFIAFCIVFNILLRFLDKLLLRIPIASPINRALGVVFSFICSFAISYVVIGAFGGIATYASSEFIRTQMESSYLVRFIYENNIIQFLF